MVRISSPQPRSPTTRTVRTQAPTGPSWPEHNYWRPADWVVLVIALGAIGAGLVLGNALLLAGGLVLAVSIGHLVRCPDRATQHR